MVRFGYRSYFSCHVESDFVRVKLRLGDQLGYQ